MFKNLVHKFVKEEDGFGFVEFLALAALIALIAILFFPAFRTALMGWVESMFKNVDNALTPNTTGHDAPSTTPPADW